jgi:flagellar hook-basal body complex protein FliE
MNIDGIAPAPATSDLAVVAPRPAGGTFGAALADAIDGAAGAIDRADGLAGAVAIGGGDVVQASIARAKADVMLEVVAATASRVSGALNSLLQTQV